MSRPVAPAAWPTSLLTSLLASLVAFTAPAASATVVAYTVVDDGIPAPLSGLEGDVVRGRAIVANRQLGLCLLCHSGPFPEERTPGNIATDLTGAGTRWTTAQLRLRVVDSRRLDPASVMPAYHRISGLQQVGTAWQDRPILSAQQLEDVVAFLASLK